MKNSPLRTGRRNEISLLVFCTLLLLAMLSIFQLYVLRDTVSRFSSEQQAQAERLARQVASSAFSGSLPSSEELRQLLPNAVGAAIYDEAARTVIVSTGPDFIPAERVLTGTSELMRDGRRHRVEVRIDASLLMARKRSTEILTWVIMGVDIGVLVLMMAFVRRWLRPLDRLLDHARALGDPADEVTFLMRQFDRALQEMSEPQEEGLRALEGSLVRSMQSGVLLIDAAGTVLALNEIGGEILKVDSQIPPDGSQLETVLASHPSLRDLLQGAIAGQAVFRQECAIELESERRELGLTAHPLRRDDGEVQGWLVMFADLTDVKRRLADERLSESLRQIGELTAGVAHEMRNGLATLKGYLSLIERSKGGAIDDYVKEIRLETEHLHRVVEDFLDFAQPGSVRMEYVDLIALLQRVAADPARISEDMESEGLEPVKVSVSGSGAEGTGAFRAQGDSTLLARALGNLVTNAIQAQREMPNAGPVRLGVDSAIVSGIKGYRIQVEDRGAGIPEEMRGRIFEAFASGRSDGVGLGLSLARRIILLHGGELELRDREGGGTVAEVFLPAGMIGTKGNK